MTRLEIAVKMYVSSQSAPKRRGVNSMTGESWEIEPLSMSRCLTLAQDFLDAEADFVAEEIPHRQKLAEERAKGREDARQYREREQEIARIMRWPFAK